MLAGLGRGRGRGMMCYVNIFDYVDEAGFFHPFLLVSGGVEAPAHLYGGFFGKVLPGLVSFRGKRRGKGCSAHICI
jgi:hypothetical protein